MTWKQIVREFKGLTSLEREALDAHHRRETWATFHRRTNQRIVEALGIHWSRYHEVVGHLLHVLTTGDAGGERPPEVEEPWLIDNVGTKPADTGTTAALDWSTIGGAAR